MYQKANKSKKRPGKAHISKNLKVTLKKTCSAAFVGFGGWPERASEWLPLSLGWS